MRLVKSKTSIRVRIYKYLANVKSSQNKMRISIDSRPTPLSPGSMGEQQEQSHSLHSTLNKRIIKRGSLQNSKKVLPSLVDKDFKRGLGSSLKENQEISHDKEILKDLLPKPEKLKKLNSLNSQKQIKEFKELSLLRKTSDQNALVKSSSLKMLNNNEKNDYQKKLTNQISIDKYKVQCLQLLKEDDELKNIVEKIKIPDLGKFIDDYFFNDLSFQYKLELFLIQKNGNTKNKKTGFFKDEILKVLNYRMLDYNFEEKMNSVINKLDQQFKKLEKFNIINEDPLYDAI